MIRVIFHGELQTLTGQKETSVAEERMALADLLHRLGRQYPPLAGIVDNNGRTELGDIMILRGGRLCLLPRDRDLVLTSGESLHLIPPIAGGKR